MKDKEQPRYVFVDDIVLRFLTIDDLENVKDMLSDSEVMKFIGPRRALNENEVRKWIETNINEYKGAWNRWAIAWKSTNEFIGMVGIKREHGINDFGYYLRKKYWGRGIAAKGIKLAMNVLNENYMKYEIFINDDNSRSLKTINSILSVSGVRTVKNGENGILYTIK